MNATTKTVSRIASAIGVVLLAGSAVHAAPVLNMKPGLWESSSKVDFGDSDMSKAMAQMQQQMASMPAEQRKAMEAAMSKAGGSNMPHMTMNRDGSTSTTSCMTKEMIDKGVLPMPAKNGCTQQHAPGANGSLDSTVTCTSPPSNGKVHFKPKGDSAFTMTIRSVSTINGKQQPMNVDITGKWLSANCGSVKPIVLPQQ